MFETTLSEKIFFELTRLDFPLLGIYELCTDTLGNYESGFYIIIDNN